MRILLTTPPMRSFNVSGVVFTNFGPYNLARLAANLPELPGGGRPVVRIADYNTLRLREHRLAEDIRDFEPDLIGIANPFSGYTRGVVEMARLARRLRPQAVLVAGGQAATFQWERHLRGGFDFVVRFEGERVFADLVRFLAEGGRPRAGYPGFRGVAYWDGEVPKQGQRAAFVRDLDALRPADRDVEPRRRGLVSPGWSALTEIGRGCPYHCSFCSQPGMWGRYRRRSNEAILAELEDLARRGFTEVNFVDDTVGVDHGDPTRFPDVTTALFEEIARRGLNLKIGLCLRADTTARHPEMVDAMVRAGLVLVNMGFESYTRGGLAAVGKSESSLELNRRASRILRERGVLVWGSHIYGAPSQTDEDLAATARHGPEVSDFFRLTMASPLPGSAAYHKMLARGIIDEDASLDNTYWHYNFKDGRDPDKVRRDMSLILARYYASPASLGKLLHRDRAVRRLARRTYQGVAFFALHRALGAVGAGIP